MKPDYVSHHLSLPHEIKAEMAKMPVAYIGMGILEWHGEHNPVGLDGVKADGCAIHFARKFGGVVMPPLFYGDFRERTAEVVFTEERFPTDQTGPICDLMGYDKAKLVQNARRSELHGRWALWLDLVSHIFFELESFGYKLIVPVPGHYPLIGPTSLAAERYRLEGGKSEVFSVHDRFYDDTGNAGDHAGAFETSLMLALFPELVEMGRLSPDLSVPNIGVGGDDPRTHASAEYGREILGRFDFKLEARMKELGYL